MRKHVFFPRYNIVRNYSFKFKTIEHIEELNYQFDNL